MKMLRVTCVLLVLIHTEHTVHWYSTCTNVEFQTCANIYSSYTDFRKRFILHFVENKLKKVDSNYLKTMFLRVTYTFLCTYDEVFATGNVTGFDLYG